MKKSKKKVSEKIKFEEKSEMKVALPLQNDITLECDKCWDPVGLE